MATLDAEAAPIGTAQSTVQPQEQDNTPVVVVVGQENLEEIMPIL